MFSRAFWSASSRSSHASGTGCERRAQKSTHVHMSMWHTQLTCPNALSHARLDGLRPCCLQTTAALERGSKVHERIRPREDGSQASEGRARLNAARIWAYSASVRRPSMTVFLLQHKLVASRPEMFNAFHTAPVDPPSNRENSNISRCRWQTHLNILGTAPPALRFCNTMHGMLKPSPCSTLKLSICSGPAAMGPRRSTCRPRNKCWNVH